jgi:CubicO group peptidase (beta-lactamase class C family)
MRASFLLSILLVACAAPPSPGCPAPAAAMPLEGSIAQARALATRRVAAGAPALSAAVAIDGKTVWSEAFGYADLATHRKATTSSLFRIGSVSKPLSSIAVAQLVASGALDLDAPVQKYAPTFPVKSAPITPRQLAGHVSGIRHYQGNESNSAVSYPSLTAGLAMFQNDPLLFEPGTRFEYSSYAWNLLGVVVEGASHQDFLGYMAAHVIGPLGMTHTVADHAARPPADRVSFYEQGSDGAKLGPAVDQSYKWPSGGYLSTPEDLVKLGNALVQPGFLTAESLRLLFTPIARRQNDNGAPPYGLGWIVDTQLGRRRYFHTGGSVGGSTYFAIYPEQRLVVAVVANLTETPDLGGEAIAEAFFRDVPVKTSADR